MKKEKYLLFKPPFVGPEMADFFKEFRGQSGDILTASIPGPSLRTPEGPYPTITGVILGFAVGNNVNARRVLRSAGQDVYNALARKLKSKLSPDRARLRFEPKLN